MKKFFVLFTLIVLSVTYSHAEDLAFVDAAIKATVSSPKSSAAADSSYTEHIAAQSQTPSNTASHPKKHRRWVKYVVIVGIGAALLVALAAADK